MAQFNDQDFRTEQNRLVAALPKPNSFGDAAAVQASIGKSVPGTPGSQLASPAPQDTGSPFLIAPSAAAGVSKGQMPGNPQTNTQNVATQAAQVKAPTPAPAVAPSPVGPSFNPASGTGNSQFAAPVPQELGSPFLIAPSAAAGVSKGQMPSTSRGVDAPSPAATATAPIAQPLGMLTANTQTTNTPQPQRTSNPLVPPPADAAQIASDRNAIAGAWNTVKDWNDSAGRAIADVATIVPRGLAGAYDTAVVRPMRAAGIDASYLSPMLTPDGADPSSMTPFMDIKRKAEAARAGAASTPTTGVSPGSAEAQKPSANSANPLVAASTAGAGRGSVNPPLANPNLPPPSMTSNQVTRVGNSYSDGGKDIGGNILVNGRTGGGTVNTISSDAMRGRNSGNVLVASALDAAAARGDFNAIAGYYANQGQGFDGQSAEQIRASQSGPQGRVMNVGTLGFDPEKRNASWEADKMMNILSNPNASRSEREAAGRALSALGENTRAGNRLVSEERRHAAGLDAAMDQTLVREQGDNFRASQRNVLAAADMGLKQREADRQGRLTDAQLQDVQRKQGITARYDEAKTDAERASIMQQHPEVFGIKTQQPQGKDRFITTGGGTSVVDGQTVKEPTRVFDTLTQQFVGDGGAQTTGQPVTITNDAAGKQKLASLPAGSVYTGPDGKQYRKG